MNTVQIYKILSGLFCPQTQYDVLACDELDTFKLDKYPIALVVNNKPSTHQGEHWLSLFIQSGTSPVNMFCSYGIGIESYSHHFQDFVNRHGKGSTQNNVQLQSPNSDVCGQYAIWFLWKRVCGYSIASVYNNFSNDFKRNDRLVKQFLANKIYLLNRKCKYCKIKQSSIKCIYN